jgi:riboflavin synthase
MFTGIIETKGVVARTERVAGGMRLEIYAPDFGRDMAIGDSVAVDGVCLTVVKFLRGAFLVDVSDETVLRSTVSELRQGGSVNLERALRLSDRLGGHIVTGHVDAVGTIAMRQGSGNAVQYRFTAPAEVREFLVEKGSIAVDGISLTVARVFDDGFGAVVLPLTESSTTLGDKPIGAKVNLESDMFAKYIQRYVRAYVGADAGEAGSTRGSRRGLGNVLKDFTEGR